MEHKSFDELTDEVTERKLQLEIFLEDTLEMTKHRSEEEWRPQYDAV